MNENAGTQKPLISVVICTHNREPCLRLAIESVLAQDTQGASHELLVVDNRSSDGTRALCEEYVRGGRVRYVHEPQLGLCYARNTGWKSARGEIIAYFDDDAIAEPGWLNAIAEAFKSYPGAGIVGGRVKPIWEGDRPAWLSDEIAMSLTIVDWPGGPKQIPDARVEWLVGANMAIRASALEEIGGFEPKLDRIGNSMLSGGDVFLQHRVIECGYGCIYFPQMTIGHLVPTNRLEQRWFTRRYYWQGISDAVMVLIRREGMGRGERMKVAGRELIKLMRDPRQIVDAALPTEDAARFQRKCFALIRIGLIVGLLGKAQA